MVVRPSVCLRGLARGRRSQLVGFGRFLANRRVTVDRLTEGWSDQTAVAVAGPDALAIQDTSGINFPTTYKRQCGPGGHGNGKRPRPACPDTLARGAAP